MIGERIAKARKNAGYSDQKAFAKVIGVGARTLADYETNNSEPKASTLKLIAEKCNKSLNWLLYGDENSGINVSGNENVTLSGNNSISDSFTMKKKSKQETSDNELIEIPYFEDTYAAAGHGAINYDEAPHPMSFDKSFLQKQFGIVSFRNLHIINAIGNSMEPTFKEGELLMINPFENESMQIKDGGIYVISCNNSTLVKRINHNPITGKVTLISDNKAYDDIAVEKAEFETCRIIGRVVGHFDRI